MKHLVLSEVTDKGAIYVNGTRITNRSTKWGIHSIIFSQECERNEVITILKDFGFDINKIDDPKYLTDIND